MLQLLPSSLGYETIRSMTKSAFVSNSFLPFIQINTFEGVSHKVDHIQDLADGITLFEVLSDM